MTDAEVKALEWYAPHYPDPPLRKDGSVDFECLCGEFLVECGRGSTKEVMALYEKLPAELKRKP